MRWLGFVVLLFLFPLLAADDKKHEKKPSPSVPEKKDVKKKDSKKKDDKKATEGDDEPKKEEKKPAASARTPPKAKPRYLQILAAKMGKLDNAPKYGIIIKEPFVNGNNVELRDKEVEIEASEDVIVRTEILPQRFDEKGKPILKPYTAKELKELKGPDKSLPGYAADIDSLKPGQLVSVYLGKKNPAAKTDPLVIVMICILAEP